MSLYREMACAGMRKDESVQGDGGCWDEEGRVCTGRLRVLG